MNNENGNDNNVGRAAHARRDDGDAFFVLISTVFCSDAHFSRTRHVTCKAAPLASTYHETFPRMKERHGSPKCGTNTWPIRVFFLSNTYCSMIERKFLHVNV